MLVQPFVLEIRANRFIHAWANFTTVFESDVFDEFSLLGHQILLFVFQKLLLICIAYNVSWLHGLLISNFIIHI